MTPTDGIVSGMKGSTMTITTMSGSVSQEYREENQEAQFVRVFPAIALEEKGYG